MASTGLLDLAALCALVHKSVGKVQRQFFQCECSLTLALSVQRLNRGQKCTSLVCCDPCWRACVFFLLLFFWGGGRHPALTLCFVLKCTILLHVTTILAKTGNAVVSTPFTDTSIVLEPSATMRTKKRAKARCTLHEARTRTEASAEV